MSKQTKKQKDGALLNSNLLDELVKVLQSKTLQKKLQKSVNSLSKEDKTKMTIEKEKENKRKDKKKYVIPEEKKRAYRHQTYINHKYDNYMKGIIKRFVFLDKSRQINIIVSLNEIFSQN
jgi:hypothetical protein